MRVFAGPNGSGKSTLKTVIRPRHLGVYINADEIEGQIRAQGFIDTAHFGVATPDNRLEQFLSDSPLLLKAECRNLDDIGFHVDRSKVFLSDSRVNSYIAAAMAAYLREELLRNKASFTFETVMSSPDKVALMRTAIDAGYRVYLYYIATVDPDINVSRVRNRVLSGGHDVPEAKIVARFTRSLALLYDAIRNSSRAYIFDNSTEDEEKVWIAEATKGSELELKVDQVPAWFAEQVIDKANSRA